MAELMRSLAAEVPRRIVIFDMPPLLLSDDVLRFLPNVDGLLFVVSEAMTQRAALTPAREILPEDKLLGVVLNRSHEREESGYY
jgi:non-specific protein-tyrosine kinase